MTVRFAKTDAALDRLDKAVSRLEKAFAEAPAPAAPPHKSASAIPDLFGDDELTRSRQDYARLDQASRHVEARLDTLADRLQGILDT